jgi:predicted SAM-dependent methyltransferase
MKRNYINIACGNSYLTNWVNLDYAPHSTAVQKANLLDRLPIKNNSADVVYSSHFIEHIPHQRIDSFFAECFRITKPQGKIRLVLPDFQELCTTYINNRHNSEHTKADFLILEIIDQCTRSITGGELGAYYEKLQASPQENKDIIAYVKSRTGHIIQEKNNRKKSKNTIKNIITNPKIILYQIEKWYYQLVIKFLPKAFQQQNISLTAIGEKHAWMYDFYTIKDLLSKAGFTDVTRMTAYSSSIFEFPCKPLDVTEDETPRKGAESMYIEAMKP